MRSGCCKFYVNQSKGHKKVQRWQQEALKQAVNTQVRSDCCKSKREPQESAALATTSSPEVRSDCCKSKREPSSRAGPGPAFLLWLWSPCTPPPPPLSLPPPFPNLPTNLRRKPSVSQLARTRLGRGKTRHAPHIYH